jgi:hypothetical protein
LRRSEMLGHAIQLRTLSDRSSRNDSIQTT